MATAMVPSLGTARNSAPRWLHSSLLLRLRPWRCRWRCCCSCGVCPCRCSCCFCCGLRVNSDLLHTLIGGDKAREPGAEPGHTIQSLVREGRAEAVGVERHCFPLFLGTRKPAMSGATGSWLGLKAEGPGADWVTQRGPSFKMWVGVELLVVREGRARCLEHQGSF